MYKFVKRQTTWVLDLWPTSQFLKLKTELWKGQYSLQNQKESRVTLVGSDLPHRDDVLSQQVTLMKVLPVEVLC